MRPGHESRVGGMKRIVASLYVCLAASAALGVPIFYHSGRPGSETYVTAGSVNVPGFYPVDTAIALQFRNGHLTGWKKDWRLRRPWPF